MRPDFLNPRIIVEEGFYIGDYSEAKRKSYTYQDERVAKRKTKECKIRFRNRCIV